MTTTYKGTFAIADYETYGPLFPKRRAGQNRVPARYYITCLANGRIYVGVTQDFFSRWHQHLARLRKGTHRQENTALSEDFNCYGEDAFTMTLDETITEPITKEVMYDHEEELASRFDEARLYNAHVGRRTLRDWRGLTKRAAPFRPLYTPRLPRGPQTLDWRYAS
jgi:hypothetical protein